MRKRNPVSRVDNGWFARVYRAKWVGPRSFADQKYGGRKLAEAAAWKWVAIAEERLPIIPPAPVLKEATVHLRSNSKRKNQSYFDVYLPSAIGKSWTTRKFYFRTDDKDSKKAQETIVRNLVVNHKLLLAEAHKKSMARWIRDHDRIMQEILKMWNEIKAMSV